MQNFRDIAFLKSILHRKISLKLISDYIDKNRDFA